MINQRLLTRITIALLMVGSLLALAVYSMPMIVKSHILAIVQQETGRKASLGDVQFALLPLSIQLQKFAIQETDGKPFASLESVYIAVNIPQSIKQSAVVIDKLTLVNPVIRLVKQKNGTLNIDSLFKDSADTKQSTFFPLTIANLLLSAGKLTWEDQSFKETVQPINLTVENLSTVADKKSHLALQLRLESGGQLEWQGEASLNPLQSTGQIKLNNFKLQHLLAVIVPESIATFSLTGNELFESDYQLSYDNQHFTVTADKAKIILHDFQYAEKNKNPLVIKAANFSHETDFKISYTNDAWLFTGSHSKIKLTGFDVSESTPPKNHLKAPDFSHETDFKISYSNDAWLFTGNHSKIKLTGFEVSNSTSSKHLIKLPNFSHETDFKINYASDAWSFTGKLSKMKLTGFEFFQSIPSKNFIKVPTISHQSDFKINYTHDNWQFLLNNSNIEARDIELDYLNAAIKIPEVILKTSFDTHIKGNVVQLTTQQGKLNSRNIQLVEKNQAKPLTTIPHLALDGVDFNLSKQSLSIDSLLADGADFRTWLTPEGVFNYQTLFTHTHTNFTPTAVEAKEKPWAIDIKHIALTHFATTFEDRAFKKPVMMTLKPVNFELTGYSNKAGVKLPFQLDVGMNNTGTIQVNGDATLEPFVSHLAIHANTIDLEPFQSYLEKIAHLDIVEGQLSINGKLVMAIPENQPLDLKFTGDSNINQLITRDQKRHRDFITWKSLSLKGVAVDLRKDSYTADTLTIDKPYARVVIRKNKTINFSDIFVTASQPSNTAVKTSAKSQQPYFKLNKVQIIDGASDFSDNSLILPFSAQIKSLDGGASDISSEQKSTIKVSLKGNAYDLAPVDIDGYISPYLGNYNLSLNFKGMPMPLMSPYMVEFAGYKVEKGKMSLGLKYKVVNDELTASNNILIEQFELGDKVDNPRAVSLPLEMAVALLKDSDGKIKMDVPITGSLNDPKFDIGSVISDAIVSTISKVISSPFRALASIADSDAELSTINFSAGNALLDKTQYEKLIALAKILKQRSALMLDIKGTAFQSQDWPAMRETALYDQLKKIRADEINKQGDKKILAQYVELSNADYKRLLAEMFIEKFPKLAKKSLLGKPELIDAKAGDFYEVAKQQLSITVKSEQPRLKKLAAQRAQVIASYLIKQGVPTAQIFILDTVIDPERNNNDIASLLSLKEN